MIIYVVSSQHFVIECNITHKTPHLKKQYKLSSSSFKKPKHLKKSTFIIYFSSAVRVEPRTSMNIYTEMVVVLPRNSKPFVTSIFRGDEINEICCQKHRFWVLNKSFEETVEIKKNQPLGLLAIEPENLKFEYATANKKRKQTKRIYLRTNQKRQRQLGGFLNCYDFSYAVRDTVSQAEHISWR